MKSLAALFLIGILSGCSDRAPSPPITENVLVYPGTFTANPVDNTEYTGYFLVANNDCTPEGQLVKRTTGELVFLADKWPDPNYSSYVYCTGQVLSVHYDIYELNYPWWYGGIL